MLTMLVMLLQAAEELHLDILATSAGIAAVVLVLLQVGKQLLPFEFNAYAIRWTAVLLGAGLAVLAAMTIGSGTESLGDGLAMAIGYWLFIVVNGVIAGLGATAGYDSVVSGMDRLTTPNA